MKYLGVVSLGHDASVALIDGNQVLFAAHAERYSGVKNDGNINTGLLEDCFSYGEPQAIVWYEKPVNKASRYLLTGQWEGLKVPTVKQHLTGLGLGHLPVHKVSHHKSHASGGYFTSGFNDASILVCDAIGEWTTISIWQAQGTDIKCVYSQRYPDSLGLLYSAMTHRLGLKPNEEEYIMMGMAALGDANKFKQSIIDDFIKDTPAPSFKLKENVHRGITWWRTDLGTTQDYYDLAAAIQAITEDYLLDTVRWIRSNLPSDNLILTGGVALNCKANGLIAEKNLFDNIWIMPNPGDAGSSIGAVAAHTHTHLDWRGPYLGYNIDRKLDIRSAVRDLVAGKVIGIANGRAEFGPRSLGNRSLIADPRGPLVKDRVNTIKKREMFRPFAPIVLEEHASTYWDMPYRTTPYMQYTAQCIQPDVLPAVCHYDDSSRVQTLTRDQNPVFHELLTEFYRQTGCPVLLNTSLNIKGQPLVNTWDDAVQFSNHYGVTVY